MLKRLVTMSLVLAGQASAAPPMPRWSPAGVDPIGRAIEIDRGSLNWRALQRAWWRVTYPQPRADGTVEERHLELIDCRAGTSSVIQTIGLAADGRVLNNQQDGESLALQRMSPPTPDTAGETVAIAACRMRPAPPPQPRKRR